MTQPYIERFWGEDCLIPALKAIGYSRQVSAREELPPHQEICFEFHLIMDGSVSWWVEGETYHLPPDSIYLTKPGEWHGGVKNMVQPSTLVWLQIDPLALADKSLHDELYQLDRRTWLGASQLVGLVKEMLNECRWPKPDSPRLLKAYVTLFLAKFVRQAKENDRPKLMPRPLTDLLQYIEAHLTQSVTVSDLCRHSNLSRSRIFQLFESYIGQSPISYITSLRIQQAQKLLSQSNMPITDIAMELGFSSSQHFATVFKRQTGLSPSTYRKTLF